MVQGGHCLDLFGQSKPKTATGYSIVCFDVTVLAISYTRFVNPLKPQYKLSVSM